MKTLVVIDMQNDFVGGVLGTAEAVSIVPGIKDKIDEYRGNGHRVVFTRDTHGEDYLRTQEGRKLPAVHCVKGTEGWEIISRLDVGDSIVIDKPTFGSYELVDMLRELDEESGPESIELVGVCTDICIISNAIMLKNGFPEIPVIVDETCCAGVTPDSHETALKAMEACQIDVKRR